MIPRLLLRAILKVAYQAICPRFSDDEDQSTKFMKEGDQISKDERTKRDKTLGSTNPFLDQFLGKTEDTPFYKGLVTTGKEAVGHAFDDVHTADRHRAAAAGFGYEQPAEQASQNAIDLDEERTMAQVPRQSLLAATDEGFKAAGLKTSQAGLYSPVPYFQTSANLANAGDARDAEFEKMMMNYLLTGNPNGQGMTSGGGWGEIFA